MRRQRSGPKLFHVEQCAGKRSGLKLFHVEQCAGKHSGLPALDHWSETLGCPMLKVGVYKGS
jgi:hypothetical protein